MQISRTKLTITPYFYFFSAIILLMFPLKWVFSWFVAVLVHELFHYIALRLYGVKVFSVTVGIGGAKMKTAPMSKGTETICALAGPIGGLCLLLFVRWMPYVGICALFQSAYNLLPIFPLDGGRVVLGVLEMLVPAYYLQYVYRAIEMMGFAVLLLISILALHYHLGPIPLLFTVILFLKTRKENPLANRTK